MNAIAPHSALGLFVYALAFAVALTSPCAAQQPVELVAQSANRFLSTLSDAARSKVVYEFDDNVQRA